MVEVKVTQIGNSLGIVLPRDVLEHLGLEKGSKITLTEEPGRVVLSGLDPDFEQAMEIAREGMRRYRNALSVLDN